MTSSIIGKSVVIVPSQLITQDDTYDLVDQLVSDPKEKSKVRSIVKNTNIAKRHACIPIEKVLKQDTSPGGRHKAYLPIAREFAQRVAERALFEVNATKEDIDAIIVTSCTGFAMPSLGNYLISDMGFKHTTRVLPVAQWGCAGSVAALNWAHTHCLAYPKQAVLFVAVELCSLMYQPSDTDLSMMICNSLFGDAAGGVVVMGEQNKIMERKWPHTSAGFRLLKHETFCPPDKMHYLYYDEDHEGWHFRLAPNVVSTVGTIAPYMKRFLEEDCDQDICESSMRYLVHTGGPKILQELLDEMFPQYKIKPGVDANPKDVEGCNPKNLNAINYLSNRRVRQIDNALTTMRAFGNTSSVTVLTELRLEMLDYERRIAAGVNDASFPALLVACGPGFTAEWAYGKFFARPVELRSPTHSLERPVCFTMELPKIDVLVIGMGSCGAFLSSKLCEAGLNVGSVACQTTVEAPKYHLNGDFSIWVKKLGIEAECDKGDLNVVASFKKVLLEYRTDDKLIPFWDFRVVSINRDLDVLRTSRFQEMNNDDIISVVLEHVPTGVTQQVQTRCVVATENDESSKLVEEFGVRYPEKSYVVKACNSNLNIIFDESSSVCGDIVSNLTKSFTNAAFNNGQLRIKSDGLQEVTEMLTKF